jgi:hypothetical protein
LKKELRTGLDESDIMESWCWDIDELKEGLNAIRRRIRLAEKERKLQPPLIVKSELAGEYYVTNRYQILRVDGEKSLILAESKRQATEEEIKKIKGV